jgi:hypothetical protein
VAEKYIASKENQSSISIFGSEETAAQFEADPSWKVTHLS